MIATGSQLTIALALSTVVFSSPCPASAAQPEMTQRNKKPIGLAKTEKANAELEKEVNAKIATNGELKAAKLIVSADVTKNEITLRGTVTSDSMRSKAVELAKSAQAGVLVNDQIKVQAIAAPDNSGVPSR
jgi:osmotically-inducible protein OsmY